MRLISDIVHGMTVVLHDTAPQWLLEALQWAMILSPNYPAVCVVHRAPVMHGTPEGSGPLMPTTAYLPHSLVRRVPSVSSKYARMLAWADPCGDYHVLDPWDPAFHSMPWPGQRRSPFHLLVGRLLGVCPECRQKHSYTFCYDCQAPVPHSLTNPISTIIPSLSPGRCLLCSAAREAQPS